MFGIRRVVLHPPLNSMNTSWGFDIVHTIPGTKIVSGVSSAPPPATLPRKAVKEGWYHWEG